MTKVALLIGVSDYEPGLKPLPSAVKDVDAMQQVLANPKMGEFAAVDITVLPNPDRQTMADAIYRLFANRQKDDLLLLYFSGHGVLDDNNEFYFSSRSTRKEQERLVPTTAIDALSVQKWMEQSRSQRQVIILDSCFSGAFAKGVQAKDSSSVNLEQFLGGRGRAILTASTSTQYALAPEDMDLSVYTHYLVEGIRTGGADLDDDGFIAAEELHTYASSKVKEAAPAMTPEFYPVKEGYKIILAKSPKDDPQLKYRKQVKLLAEEDEGDFSFINRAYLDDFQRSLGLSPDVTIAIETEELEPYRQRQAKVDRYRIIFAGAIAHRYPLSDRDRTRLQRLQQLLSLRDQDITAIEAPILAHRQTEYEQQQAEQQRRQQEANRLRQQQQRAERENNLRAVSPLSERSRPPVPSQQPRRLPTSPALPTITRQQFLKWAGFGSSGLVVAWIGNQIIQNPKTPEITPNPVAPGTPEAPQLLTSDFETVTVDDRGQIIKRVPGKAKFVKEDLGNGIALEMVSIPAGEFLMGTADAERDTIIREITRHETKQKDAEQWPSRQMPQHRVEVPEFWMGKFAVTQAQWSQVAGLPKVKLALDPDPSSFKGAKRPVERISWDEAVEFCARLSRFVESRLSRETGKSYRLPSEAEWEYACRAGTTTPFYFGETITSELVNCNGNYPYGNAPKGEYREKTTDVGAFPANGFGLYDMHGNVWEWCADQWYGSYANKPDQLKQNGAIAWTKETTGIVPKSDETNYRLLRGGSWLNYPVYCRSTNRHWDSRDYRYNSFGFRVVCSVPSTL